MQETTFLCTLDRETPGAGAPCCVIGALSMVAQREHRSAQGSPGKLATSYWVNMGNALNPKPLNPITLKIVSFHVNIINYVPKRCPSALLASTDSPEAPR